MIMELSSSLKLSGGDNWAVWKFQIEEEDFGIVSGAEVEPVEGKNKKVWVQNDAPAQELIVSRMESGQLTHLLSCTTSCEMLSKLKSGKVEESERTNFRQMLITKVLMSLPEQFKHFHSAWESVPLEMQSVQDLTSMLLIEEERIGSRDEEVIALTSDGHLARFCDKNKETRTCHYCNKRGHLIANRRMSKAKNDNIENEVNAFMTFSAE
ncbi:hypothetical protein PR048_009182 [Dryococelus australis]|uniref:Uncharacterized protein n=1 Tax=Dryococelus australis TaxID=614101 RepID=A0ABQ9HZ71_9NEOP|nr:hypothetical protein PR048_009182 [Dryococelus australis]